MNPFPLLSMFGRRIEPRERRTITIAASILVAALAFAYLVLPVARRWSDRESAISAARDRVARLQGLIEQRDQLVRVADERAGDASAPVRVIRGRTTSLAASTLQEALQEYARLSRVSITRLDVASLPDSVANAERGLPATVSAVTDIYGLADLLTRVQRGALLLNIEELSVAPNPVLRGNLLQLVLTVRAPFILEAP